jgi:hypothetical protein
MTTSSQYRESNGHVTRLEEQPDELSSRRSLLESLHRWTPGRRISVAAAALFAGIAARGAEPASAYSWNCCNLARQKWCASCSSCSVPFKCPSGYNKRLWTCCGSSGRLWGCGECTTGSTCWKGTFACSYGWGVGYC